MNNIEKGFSPIEQLNNISEQSEGKKEIKQYLQEHLEKDSSDIEKIEIRQAKDLPEHYKKQYVDLDDERLDNVTIAVVPVDLWPKGKEKQPSESSAENQLILMEQDYFEEENPDEIAWMSHEFAHCKNFLDSESREDYFDKMSTIAFDDLNTESTYPNNLVEKYTFTKQFEYLKKQGKNKKEIINMLSVDYKKEDIPFFERLLDDANIE